MLTGDHTVADLMQRLCHDYGLPKSVVLSVKTVDGDWAPLQDTSASSSALAPRSVRVHGAAVLTTDTSIRWRGLLEDDMLRAVGELNGKYAQPEFQDRVKLWSSGPVSEAVARMRALRDQINIAVAHVISPLGFEASAAGFKEWEKAVEAFSRFPTFAETCRKSKILLGTLQADQAWRAQRASWGEDVAQRGELFAFATQHREGQLSVMTIPSEFALVDKRSEASSVFELLHRRIYEENRVRLWKGGKVPGHEMPTKHIVARKYMEPPGALLLHCRRFRGADAGETVGGAVVCPKILHLPSRGLEASPKQPGVSRDDTHDESDADLTTGEDVDGRRVTVGYIDGLAATPSSGAGSAMLEHLQEMSQLEGWDVLVLHSINVHSTMHFWARQGFIKFGASMEPEDFAFLCQQNLGFSVRRETIERQLPSRPGCTLFMKFLER